LGKGKKIGIGIVGFFIFAISYGSFLIAEEKKAISEMSNRELLTIAKFWTYEDLLRHIEKYNGEIIHFTGTVGVQTDNEGVFGINVGKSNILQTHPYDVIFVEYDKERFLVKDKVDGFGYVKGFRILKITKMTGAQFTEEVPNLVGIRVSCTSC